MYFTTRDNVRLHAWWAPADGATKTFLYFHGNAGNLTHRIENISFLQQLPVNVLAVDYRGYGKSEGRPTEAGVYRDAEAAYDYLSKERGILSAEIVVLGQSMGSAVAVISPGNAQQPRSSWRADFLRRTAWPRRLFHSSVSLT